MPMVDIVSEKENVEKQAKVAHNRHDNTDDAIDPTKLIIVISGGNIFPTFWPESV